MDSVKRTLIVAMVFGVMYPSLSQARGSDAAAAAKANNDFAVRMYSKLAEEGGNLFFSPGSIHTALSMTFAGARGRTERQMYDVLGFGVAAGKNRWPQSRVHKACAGLLKALEPPKDAGYQLSVANALWGQKGYPWLEDFLKATRDNYGAGLREVDFVGATEAARRTINTWVEDRTKDRIKELIAKGILTGLTRLVLTNAIYFKGDWAAQFDKKATRDADFTTVGSKKVKVSMMHRKGRYGYTIDRKTGLQAVAIPYKGDELSMVVLLPKAPEDLAAMTATLTAKRLDAWIGALRTREIHLYLPRFKLTKALRLKKVLSKMGMTDAFGSQADLSGMNGKKDLYVAAVIHKAFVDVNEEGTEAAAATAVVVKLKSARRTPVFRADRPFGFLIRHNPTGTILFMGTVAEPPAATSTAAGVDREDAKSVAKAFWRALASADAAGMKQLYAPQVTVMRGSELLKGKYGLAADRRNDTTIARDNLLGAYGKLFGGSAKARWTDAFKRIGKDQVTISAAGISALACVKSGDVIMTVRTGDDNPLVYILRNVSGKGWSVVAERTDY